MQIHLNKFYQLLGFVVLVMLSSCGQSFYAPNEAILLKLNEPGDIKVSGSVGKIENENTHISVQAGYSPIKHLAVAGSYFNLLKSSAPVNNSYFQPETTAKPEFGPRGYMFEGAIGGYYFIGKKEDNDPDIYKFMPSSRKLNRGWLFDVYLGFGKGNVSDYNFQEFINYNTTGFPTSSFSSGHTELDFNKYFLQLGAHYQLSLLNISYVAKIIGLDYTKAAIIGDVRPSTTIGIERLQPIDPFIFVESNIGYEIGIRQARFKAVYTFVHKNNNLNILDPVDATFTLGAIFEIDEIFKRSNKEIINTDME